MSEPQYVIHPGYNNRRIYHSQSKPVILASDVGAILREEKVANDIKAVERWIIHVSIYPNQKTAIYNSYWRGLHYIPPGRHFDYANTRWSYIFEQTGDFISIPMTQEEAELDRTRMKLWLVNHQWLFLTTPQKISKKRHFEHQVENRKTFTRYPEVTIMLSKAVNYTFFSAIDLIESGESKDDLPQEKLIEKYKREVDFLTQLMAVKLDIKGELTGIYDVAKFYFNLVELKFERSDESEKLMLEITKNRLFKTSKKDQSSPADHELRLKDRITKHGFVIQNVKGDGNCLFYAISDQLLYQFEEVRFYYEIRKMALDWLRLNTMFVLGENGQTMGDFCYGLFPDNGIIGYCAEMEKDQAWGDHIMLIAIAQCFAINISIISSLPNNPTMKINADSKLTIYLAHLYELHYYSVRRAK